MWHLSSTKERPGIMLNGARQPEPALQHVAKQKCAGRRARGGQASTFCPLHNISDKAQWEWAWKHHVCVQDRGVKEHVFVCPPPHPSYPTVLSAHRSNVCCHRINISSIKSSKRGSISFCCSSWDGQLLGCMQPRILHEGSLSVVWAAQTTRQAHANSEYKWDHVCQTADLWGRGRLTLALLDVGAAKEGKHSVVLKITSSWLKLNCKRSILSTWSFGTFSSSHSSADQSFSGWTLMLFAPFLPQNPAEVVGQSV